VRRNPEALWRAGVQFLVLGRPDGSVITVTGPGVDVWTLLALDPTIDELVETLAARYGGDRSTVRTDVTRLVEQLVGQGFVVDG
jgi:hypothetical protein